MVSKVDYAIFSGLYLVHSSYYTHLVSEDLSKQFADAVSNGNIRILRVSIEKGPF